MATLTYHIGDLGSDEAASLAQVTALLQRVASCTPFGRLSAQMIARRYYDALANHADESFREQLWRYFFVALNVFLVLRATGSQAELDVLRSIVAENEDLLPQPVETEGVYSPGERGVYSGQSAVRAMKREIRCDAWVVVGVEQDSARVLHFIHIEPVESRKTPTVGGTMSKNGAKPGPQATPLRD